MKRVTFLLFACLVTVSVAFAQNSAITKATSAQTKGELDKAKQYIDEAVVHEKTREKGKAWYTKGQIYEAILFSENADYQSLASDALDQALDAYKKAKELEKENSTYYIFADQRIEGIWGNYLNKGAELYQKKDYANALDLFEKSIKVKPKDTTALIYAAYTAQSDKNFDKAEKFYLNLRELDYASEDMYKSLIYIQRSHHKNNDKALEYLKEARIKFPDDKDLMKEEINLLILTEKVDEAKQKLEVAIKEEPDNENLHYNLAFLYDQVGDKEKSIQHYTRAAEINPQYFDAIYNIAVINFNDAAETLNVANKMDLKTYQKDGQKYIDEANNKFKAAEPYFEKAHQIRPTDVSVLENLETIYKRLKKFDKVEEIQGKIAALGDGEGN